MLVTFHSNAYENITYFGDIATQLIKLMGHSGTIPGAIKAQDLQESLRSLQQGLIKANAHSAEANCDEDDVDPGLEKRAFPLINMLQASIKNNCDILWDV